MRKKIKAKNHISKVVINFVPCEESFEKAAEIYAEAIIKMVKKRSISIEEESTA